MHPFENTFIYIIYTQGLTDALILLGGIYDKNFKNTASFYRSEF